MENPLPDGKEAITSDDLQNLFAELRMIAASLLRTESSSPTYTPTALAISALRRAKPLDRSWEDLRWENRAHFFSALSRAMRNALVDHARRRRARGREKVVYLPPDDAVLLNLATEAEERPERLMMIEEALERLERADEALAEVFRMRFLLGLTIQEIARVRDTSEKTVARHLTRAKVLLRRFIEESMGQS
ncbi:MAG: sigma-70 family RNA polymerase sigma factor [Verrucomicrobiales bacterium]|nr:sigma-70 family RNA polymerase sigma factor [Verrucomicrobiales bacterium]